MDDIMDFSLEEISLKTCQIPNWKRYIIVFLFGVREVTKIYLIRQIFENLSGQKFRKFLENYRYT